MTPDERHKCDLFIRSLSLLDYDRSGLTATNLLSDMEAIAQTCLEIRAITAEGATPFELALRRLALLTEHVLTTYIIPDPPAIPEWLAARAEVSKLHV
jgi:hypothetical protein